MNKPIDEALFFSSDTDSSNEETVKEQCFICFDDLHIPFELPCKHKAHYNCLMGVVNKLCPLCRNPIPKELYKKAEVNTDVLKDADKLLWMYKARSGRGWWFFDPNIAFDIEKAYQEFLEDRDKKETTYTVRGHKYTINFVTMVQTSHVEVKREVYRRSSDNDRRDIKVLGVGGLVSSNTS